MLVARETIWAILTVTAVFCAAVFALWDIYKRQHLETKEMFDAMNGQTEYIFVPEKQRPTLVYGGIQSRMQMA
jgi:hypothetical protein